MEAADFGGYATKAGIRCSDGRTITAEAFKHMDGMIVPLVWSHGHNDPANVLGHAVLEARPDGVYAHGYFNDTAQGVTSKALVKHGDIKALSIYANQLVEKASQVLHGMIREVSLVLSGANRGALIDYVAVAHADGQVETLEDEAVIHTGEDIELTPVPFKPADPKADVSHGDQQLTAQQVYDGLSDVEKDLVHFMIGQALEQNTAAGNTTADTAQHSDASTEGDATKPEGEGQEKTDPENKPEDGEGDLSHKEGTDEMTRNVFEQQDKDGKPVAPAQRKLTHSDLTGIMERAGKTGSLKHAVEEYALSHGIENIDTLFPDAKAIAQTPEFNQRRMEWVAGVLGGTRHVPFSRIKSLTADLTYDDARAKGYIKGNFKKEEFFAVSKRTTSPTTVYKKQKLDRDDILDITDFDVVAWLKAEIRMMLEEELARAILIGDGRAVDDDDKIKDPIGATDGVGIRSIVNDHEMYVTTVYVNLLDANSSYSELVESVLMSRRFYKGSGTPNFYTTEDTLTRMLLAKDTTGRRLWNSQQELELALRVGSIIPVEVMEGDTTGLIGIIVNLADYTVGTDAGGDINFFDDFDIDYNQYKYLMETRLSGGLTKLKSALVIRETASANVLIDPITEPTFVESTGVVTIPTQTHVVYKNSDTNATLSAGAQTALSAGATLNVIAVAASGYYFATNAEDQWSFTRPAA